MEGLYCQRYWQTTLLRGLAMAKGSVIGECKLCNQVSILCRSHILPEFLWKGVYWSGSSSRRLHKLQVTPGATPQGTYEQKAPTEHLLCGDCEQKLGRWEKYVKENLLDKFPANPDDQLIAPLDSNKLFLFQLSLLWRCSITTISDLRLGIAERTIASMRDALLNENYRACQIHFNAGRPILKTSGQMSQHMTDAVFVTMEHYEKGTLHRILAGGIVWSYAIGHQTPTLPLHVHFPPEPDNAFDYPFILEVASTVFKKTVPSIVGRM